LTLPDQLEAGLNWIAEFLDQWLPRSSYAIGGGTVLAARWEHRLSTDIDLFSDERQLSDALEPNTWRELSESLNQRATIGAISDLVLSPTGFSFNTPTGPISFSSMPRETANAISREREVSTGIYAEHNAEILFKKLRGRMVNSSRYVARDLYDSIVCYELDRESLNEAMHTLSALERDSLRYDVQKGDTRVRDLNRILSPRYPGLVADLERFNLVAGEILAQNVSASADRFLREIGITN